MAVIKNYNLNNALNLFNAFGVQFTNTIYSARLANETDTTLLVPSGTGTGKLNDTVPKLLAKFSYQPGVEVWVGNNVTTAAPSLTGAFVANGSVINPECKEVFGGDTLHFYCESTGTADVSVEFYAI